MKKTIRLDTGYLKGFVSDDDLNAVFPEAQKASDLLADRDGPGSDFLGWMDLPENTSGKLIEDIEKTAAGLNKNSDALIVIGIGGSYLGSRAAIEALSPGAVNKTVFFAGCNLSGDHINNILEEVKDREVSVNVISKSGTTTEPALAFRIIKDFLEKKYGAGKLKDRIVCTTDKEKGALRAMSEESGYGSFVIPDDVGGRFSVLTPVGLLPIAYAGINIRELIAGAKAQRQEGIDRVVEEDPSCRYAAVRNILYRKDKKIEIFSSFDHRMRYVAEWWKQLFGESEGKDNRGIFPAACNFSTDLHSMGQMIQQGERNLFETFLIVEETDAKCVVPREEKDLDNLNYLAGKQVDDVNRKAYEATAEAHFEGGVPVMTLFLPERSAFCLGRLFYFFERAVAVSAYISGVNPFDQPGVEAYKKKMFKLLGKPGA